MLTITDGTTWVTIEEYSEGGYYYSIYNINPHLPENEDCEDEDGGLCTGNLADAIIMSTSQAGMVDPNEERQPQEDEEDDDDTMTEQEHLQFYALLKKFIDDCDMQYMHLGKKAKALLDAIDEI